MANDTHSITHLCLETTKHNELPLARSSRYSMPTRQILGLIEAAASSPCDVAAGEQVFIQGLEPLGLAESGE